MFGLFSGKPGTGKTFEMMRRLVDDIADWIRYEEREGEEFPRKLYTNIVINIDGLNRTLSDRLGKEVDASKYIVFLDDAFFNNPEKIYWWETFPALGSFLYCTGQGVYKPKTGELRLSPSETKHLQESEKTLDGYMRGLMIQGCGQVVDKKSRIINRQPLINALIKFQGGLHNFSGLTPEIYNRVPQPGSYCSFELDLAVSKVRDDKGNTQQIYLPALKEIRGETLGGVPAPKARETAETKAAS